MSLLKELPNYSMADYKHLAPNGAPIFKASQQSLKL
jgi:hypothetical protein